MALKNPPRILSEAIRQLEVSEMKLEEKDKEMQVMVGEMSRLREKIETLKAENRDSREFAEKQLREQDRTTRGYVLRDVIGNMETIKEWIRGIKEGKASINGLEEIVNDYDREYRERINRRLEGQ